MNTKFLLPLAAISALALAACDNTPPPAQPDPDAGPDVSLQETPAEDTTETVPAADDVARTAEEIEQEAAETFEQIMEQTQQTGSEMIELGTNAMQAIGQQADQTADALGQQIDAIVEGAESLRDENMTDEQKLEVVVTARNAAEAAARQLGRTEVEIIAAGDEAEARARAAMGL